MAKTGRNDSCPCGSGLKFKKCCLRKTNNSSNTNVGSFENFIKSNNSVELLKIFSLLQLIPKNQSKLIRLETIQDSIICNLNSIENKINYSQLKKVIHKNFESDYREDPNECSFTENITFNNGNNIVFPGISNESTNINQLLINGVHLGKFSLSSESKIKIFEGTIFLLSILNEIAIKLEYTRYMFEGDFRNKITFPNESFVNENKHLLVFSRNEINEIYAKFGIKSDIITQFLTTISEIQNHKGDETILIDKPFIKIDGTYILALPSSQMYCLNQFIIRVATENGEIEELEKAYDLMVRNELKMYLSPNWKRKISNLNISEDESIWQFDNNKFAYVCYLSKKSNKNIEKRANKIIKSLKKSINKDGIEILCLHIFAPFSIKEMNVIGFKTIKESTFQLAMNCFDLGRIITFWQTDKLTFWKYAKAHKRAEDKGLVIAPFFSILASFKWYKRNKESFFESDDETPHYIMFDFAVQGKIAIDANKKNDRHFIYYISDESGERGYIPVFKSKEYAPIYTSLEIFDGKLRVALEKFECPIWVSCKEKYDSFGSNFIDAILYWLNEMYVPLSYLFKGFGKKYPVEIILVFEKGLRDFSNEEFVNGEESQEKVDISYRISPGLRKIELSFPKEFFRVVHRNDNYGEIIIMDVIIKGFNNLLESYQEKSITEYERKELLKTFMPLSGKKMILTSSTHDLIKLNPDFIPNSRYICDSDTSIILEENTKWLNRSEDVPKIIKTEKEKVQLCEDLINSLINQLRIRLKNYNTIELLKFLTLRYESLLHNQGLRDLSIAAKLECFSKYEDVIKTYQKNDVDLVKSCLASRSLIEFVIAEPYTGGQVINDDDLDFLMALMTEIINYGALKDSIKFKLDNPKMGLLPSGRIGISHEFYDNILTKFRGQVTQDEITKYKDSFSSKFIDKQKENSKDEKIVRGTYHDKVDKAFKSDWSLTLPMVADACTMLSMYCFESENSYYSCGEKELIKIFKDETNLEEENIHAFIKYMSLETRGKMDSPVNVEDYPDIFPWRYNRDLSYIRRPLIKLKVEGDVMCFWSARHMDIAKNNFLALFFNGSLKVNNKYKKINKLLSERNNIKGKEFRDDVYNLIKDIPQFKVVDHEVKIKENGVFNADRNYGDVDILAFDKLNKIIYSIECKNTKQAKIMYDFQNSLRNYLEKQLPKHEYRDNWLKDNIEKVLTAFNIENQNYKVKSIVVSSYQVPIKFIKKTKIPIYSIQELKRGEVFLNL